MQRLCSLLVGPSALLSLLWRGNVNRHCKFHGTKVAIPSPLSQCFDVSSMDSCRQLAHSVKGNMWQQKSGYKSPNHNRAEFLRSAKRGSEKTAWGSPKSPYVWSNSPTKGMKSQLFSYLSLAWYLHAFNYESVLVHVFWLAYHCVCLWLKMAEVFPMGLFYVLVNPDLMRHAGNTTSNCSGTTSSVWKLSQIQVDQTKSTQTWSRTCWSVRTWPSP